MTKRLLIRQFGSLVWRFLRQIRVGGKPFFLASALTILGVAFIAYCFGVWRIGGLDSPLLTTTVNAATESISFRTPDGRESAWSLPPGRFSILGFSNKDECDKNDFEVVCDFSQNTRLVVEGPADIAMQMSPGGGWMLSVAETEESPTDITLYDASGMVLMESQQLLEFHAADPAIAIRVPFVADSAVLGADLHQASTIDGTLYDFWQPVLLSGDVLMIADNRPSRETYRVLEERLDPGDVLHVGDSDSAERAAGQSTVWGMVTVTAGDATRAIGTTFLQVVLHTSVREVSVKRFGAPEGHIIRASGWTIRQKWPNGQSAWVFFVSALLVLTFVLELSGTFAAFAAKTDETVGKNSKEADS